MSNKEGQDNLAKIGFYMIGGILFILIYVFTYPLMKELNLTNIYVDDFLVKILPNMPIFNNLWIGKIGILAITFFVILIGQTPKKTQNINGKAEVFKLIIGLLFFFLSNLLIFENQKNWADISFIILTIIGLGLIYSSILKLKRIVRTKLLKDRFNRESTQFMQTIEKIETDYSVNIPYEFNYQGKLYKGYINYVNLFRALAVLGVPGSGKSYAIIEEIMKQFIQKGFSLYVYDYKYPTLSKITYNYLLTYNTGYKKKPRFYVVNFDDLSQSNRCNPISKKYLTDMTDAVESAKTIMYALNRTWAKKDGDFFPESAVNFVAICIWVLSCISEGEYSTFPHLIELVSLPYDSLFSILEYYGDGSVKNMLAPYLSAYKAGATDQLEGQLGTVRIALSRLTSPILYWIMSADEVPFQINDPENPALFCVGNNPQRRQIYGAAISLINFRVMQLINKQDMNPCGLIIDELPTIYPGKGVIDDLIGTGRSNKIATILGFQDVTQMIRDLGKESADSIIGTIGNLASGTVLGSTAESLSKRMGKIKIKKESITLSKEDTSTNISEDLVDVLPASEISNLTQGTMFGVVADEFGNVIEEKKFIGRITLDKSDQGNEEMPIVTDFYNPENPDQEISESEKYAIDLNFKKIREDVEILAREVEEKCEEIIDIE